MNINNVIKIYTENLNANVLIAFKQSGMEIDKTTYRQKGQIKNQRFYAIKKGVAKFTLKNGKEIIGKSGDILYFPPDVVYKSHWETNDNATFTIHFTLTIDGEEICISDEIFTVLNESNAVISSLFESIYNNYISNEYGSLIKIKSQFYEVLHLISLYLYKQIGLNLNNSVLSAVKFIELNYLNEINVDNLAKNCKMSQSAFRQKFKQLTGCSPIKYKNVLIIEKAKQLLSSGEFTVSEVATALKFNDLYYFSRLFKEITGVSPIKYKNELYSCS